MQRSIVSCLLALLCSACTASGQEFEQVNTTSPQTLSGPKTLTAPILTNPTISGTVSGTYALGGTPTLTGASITGSTIASPILSGTVTGTYTLGGSPSLVAAVLSGTMTGSYTLGGTPTITAPILSGTITGTYTLGGTPTITSPTIASPTVTGASIFGGTIRLPNNTYYLGRNAANSADVSLAKINASDQIEFGGTVKSFSLDANPTTSLQAATKQYVDARLGYQNPVINGTFEIWQRGSTFPAIANGAYSADRWKWDVLISTAAVTINRSTTVPTVAEAGVLFNYSLEVDVTTADAAVGAGDWVALTQIVEGSNWRHFAQRDFTISFWVQSSKTGIHSVAIGNGADRTYIAEYTVNAANTWEQKTITVPASPSAGTWNYTNGSGLYLTFVLMNGSTWTGTVGSWQAFSGIHGSASGVNVMDSTANFFRLAGVKMELGSTATPLLFRSFQDELALCQRYYQKSFAYETTPAQNVGQLTGEALYMAITASTGTEKSATIPLSPVMRTVPTITKYNPFAANADARNETRGENGTSTSIVGPWPNGFMIQHTGTASTLVGDTFGLHWTASAELP